MRGDMCRLYGVSVVSGDTSLALGVCIIRVGMRRLCGVSIVSVDASLVLVAVYYEM